MKPCPTLSRVSNDNQARAEECLAIAETLGDPHLRAQYMKVAESYLKLVEIELNSLSGHHARTN